jgi:hypothetical protein
METYFVKTYSRSVTDAEEIAALKAQIQTLTERLDHLHHAFTKTGWSTANHVRRLDASILDLREGLNITYRELFPGLAADYQKIEEFMGPVTTKKKKR